ncbi:MAG: hypothetical protein GY763_10940 [Gammaproteobacteria bacterium]|nr:hypothetical protein [Gammaproteobacteria bacterium]
MASDNKKLEKRISIGIAVLIVIFILELFVLSGEVLLDQKLSLDASKPQILQIERVGEEHLINIKTLYGIALNDKDKSGVAIEVRLEGPDGTILLDESEYVPYKRHYYTFTPTMQGKHKLYIKNSEGSLSWSGGNGRLKLYVGDKRVFGPIFESLPSF